MGQIFSLLLLHSVTLSLALMRIALRSPANESTLLRHESYILNFDVYPANPANDVNNLINSGKYDICVRLDLSAVSCNPLSSDIWPVTDNSSKMVLSKLLPGQRLVELFICNRLETPEQKGREIISTALYVFQVKDSEDSENFDIFSLTNKYGISTSLERRNVFDEVFRTAYWSLNREDIPVSGSCSTIAATVLARQALTEVLTSLNVTVLLDAPCGDMSWVPLVFQPSSPLYGRGVRYIGGDISALLIEDNIKRIQSLRERLSVDPVAELQLPPRPGIADRDKALLSMDFGVQDGITFRVLDLVSDPLRPLGADLILCRYMMFHLSVEDNIALLANVAASGARYFMATTYFSFDNSTNFGEHKRINSHEINLLLPPYCLPAPLRMYKESWEIGWMEGSYLGVWEVPKGSAFSKESC